jgi:hypothetical protein
MTTRELYSATITALRENEPESALATEFEALIEKMDAQNAARKVKTAEKAAEAQAAKAPIRQALFNVLGDAENPKTASMLIDEAGLTDTVKPASIPSLMRPFVEDGSVLKVDMKVPGHGTQRGYVLA